MLTFLRYIEKSKCDVPELYINNFHKYLLQNSTDKIVWVALTDELIELIGFKGANHNRNKNCMKIIRRNFEEGTDFKKVKEKDFEQNEYVKKQTSSKSTEKRGQGKKIYYFVTGDTVEQLLMMTRTETAKITRQNYIQLKKMMYKYAAYQMKFIMQEKYSDRWQAELNKDKLLEKKYKIMHRKKDAIRKIDKKVSDMQRIGCIYFIRENNHDIFKIGYTYTNVKNRIVSLQVANSSTLTIYNTILCQYAECLEKNLHAQYDKYNIRGEWFNLSSDQIDNIILLNKCNI